MALEVTGERVREAAARLGRDGLRFSGRQLYYQACRDVELPRTRMAPGMLGLGAVLVLLGMIVGALLRQPAVLFGIALLGLVAIALGIVLHTAERRPLPDTRVLALSYLTFANSHLRGDPLPGMVVSAAPADEAKAAAALVVCDTAETAAVIRANRERLPVPVHVLDAAAAEGVAGRASVVVLHDCDPAGCALVPRLRARGLTVVDAGLNPRDVAGRRLQVLEGAPARVPIELTQHLDEAELEWLRSGRRYELAALTPAELLERVATQLPAVPA